MNLAHAPFPAGQPVPNDVSAAFQDRIQKFVCDLRDSARGSSKGRPPLNDPRPSRVRAAQTQAYIRKLRAREIVQPGVEKAWESGGALGVISGHRWVSPVVFLFVCGHYGHVAAVMRAATARIAPKKLSAMAAALPVLCASAHPPESIAAVRTDLVSAGFSEMLAQQAAAREHAMANEPLAERALWALDSFAYATFEEAWQSLRRSGLPMNDPAIATCQLIAGGATFPVADRDRITAGLIADALLAAGG